MDSLIELATPFTYQITGGTKTATHLDVSYSYHAREEPPVRGRAFLGVVIDGQFHMFPETEIRVGLPREDYEAMIAADPVTGKPYGSFRPDDVLLAMRCYVALVAEVQRREHAGLLVLESVTTQGAGVPSLAAGVDPTWHPKIQLAINDAELAARSTDAETELAKAGATERVIPLAVAALLADQDVPALVTKARQEAKP